MYNRREFAGLALAALPLAGAAKKINSRVNGVLIGCQSYSFRDRPLDGAIKALAELGFGECELWDGHVEPQKTGRDELRKWRLTAPLDGFQAIRKKFDDAGVLLYAYNYSFRDDYTDAEMERGFDMAKALGVKYITASATLSAARRVAPLAAKHKIYVAMHGHSDIKNPNEFAKPESFEKAMSYSPWIRVNLDIGHFTAAGYDAVEFIRKYHDKIVTMHIKDRKKNNGDNVPFGQGHTPIKAVLQLLKNNKWDIPANIEYEYKGKDPVEEVRRCFEYCKQALA
jgi:sugar phosphate isomerase/epimerase